MLSSIVGFPVHAGVATTTILSWSISRRFSSNLWELGQSYSSLIEPHVLPLVPALLSQNQAQYSKFVFCSRSAQSVIGDVELARYCSNKDELNISSIVTPPLCLLEVLYNSIAILGSDPDEIFLNRLFPDRFSRLHDCRLWQDVTRHKWSAGLPCVDTISNFFDASYRKLTPLRIGFRATFLVNVTGILSVSLLLVFEKPKQVHFFVDSELKRN